MSHSPPFAKAPVSEAPRRPRRHPLSVGLLGLGLMLVGGALWFLLIDVRDRFADLSAEFTAIPVEVSFESPALTLYELNGPQRSLKDYSGQVVLVNLWATWCPPCAAEMPGFQRFYEKYRDSRFIVIAINDGESAPEIRKFATDYSLTFPIWLDPTYEATERAFKAANLPTSYVIDRRGTVRLMWVGAISESNLERYVSPIIKE